MSIIKVIGYDIEFPFQPYAIQRAMISKLSQTLTNKENLLLESPTGTGKTLVLLCSALSWQKKSKSIGQPMLSRKLREHMSKLRLDKLMSKPCTCGRRENGDLKDCDGLKKGCDDLKKKECCDIKDNSKDIEPKFKAGEEFIEITDDDDIEIIEPKCKSDDDIEIIEHPKSNPKEEKPDEFEPMCKSCQAIESEKQFTNIVGDSAGEKIISSKIKSKIPRIYYGTRTHKQITQAIRELNKTSYKEDLRMCILSARERACINPEVRDLASRNDKCQELIKNKPDSTSMSKARSKNKEYCPFYTDSSHIAAEFEMINLDYKTEAWDIEDAAKFGIEHSVCPYYGIRSLQEQADITFCPYNYLLDPNIRKSMNINLNNAIVIIDEAHNIEDICRDSASFLIDSILIDELVETIRTMSFHYVQGSAVHDAYQFFKDKFLNLAAILRSQNNQPDKKRQRTDDSYSSRDNTYLFKKIVPQNELVDFMSRIGLGPDSLEKMRENLKALKGDDDEPGEKSSKSNNSENQDPILSFAQMQYINQLCICLDFMYADNSRNINDFRLVLTEALERGPQRRNAGPLAIVPADSVATRDKHVWKFHLLCMNPGIAFGKIHNLAWSVIVASGTLSPTESLKTELGCKFNNTFEGKHVVTQDRIFATIVPRGPKGSVELKCVYQESLKLEFQDEVGAVVQDVCTKVPNGVLCFFPSYERLESFYQRWNTTSVMKEIEKGKRVFREQKNQGAAKFEEELSKYNDHAKRRGALLFAVFRGKVSEGIDFADEAARAVITIGIPFPNFNELNVGLKKDYNDIMKRERGHLMSGNDWYSAQAFRALNQAVGRCIRHKDDWGAIIMIDSRLKYDSYFNSISKWLRQLTKAFENYGMTRAALEQFVVNKNDQ